jgi:glutaminase
MLLDHKAFEPSVKTHRELHDHLELYFMTKALTITAKQMAVVGATLANGGVNPLTGTHIYV